jgi:hypothetical protein
MPLLSCLGCEPARCDTGHREVRIQADGGHATWRAETMQNVRYFSAADGFRRDVHAAIRREAQRQVRPRRRSKLQVLARARTDARRLDGRGQVR